KTKMKMPGTGPSSWYALFHFAFTGLSSRAAYKRHRIADRGEPSRADQRRTPADISRRFPMAWSASQYVKFEDERTRPARDLLAQVPLAAVSNAIDLGCGPGNSTELIVERYGVDNVSGLDSDDNMLEAARKRLPQTRFDKADLSTWQPSGQPDLLF